MEKKEEYFEKEYMTKMNRVGKITGYLGVFVSFAPAVVLAIVYGITPQPAALLTAFISIASAVGVLWFVEPISYFAVLGPIGTYMSCLSGNISNMRLPCASIAQVSAGVEPGSKEGTIISSIGMAVSIVINISVLTIGVVLGSSVLSMLPIKVTEALNYLLPALFGALLVQFGMKQKKHAVMMLIFAVILCIAINAGIFSWIPGSSNYLHILASVFVSIAAATVTYKKGKASKAE